MINTDIKSNFNDTIAIYQIRWTIEVFFKESKQSLQLGKCQSKNFDAQIADTTLTFIQYQFLAIKNQLDRYESLGEHMRNTKAERLELTLYQRLITLLMSILEHLSHLFEDVENDSLISKIIYDERVFIQIKTLIEMEKQPKNQAA